MHIGERVPIDSPLNLQQHAYQSGKSSETALHQLVTKLEAAHESREIATTAILNSEGALVILPSML